MDLQLFSLYHTNKPGPCKIIYFLSLKSHQPESQHSSLNKILFRIGYDFFQVDPATDLLSVRRVSDGRLLFQMTDLNFTKATVKVISTFFFQYIDKVYCIDLRLPEIMFLPREWCSKEKAQMRESMGLESTGQER